MANMNNDNDLGPSPSEAEIDEYLKNVPQEVWTIYGMIVHAVRQKDARAFERQLIAIEAAIRLEAVRQALQRGAEPFWMQDVRSAQRRIDAQRRAILMAGRPIARPRPDQPK